MKETTEQPQTKNYYEILPNSNGTFAIYYNNKLISDNWKTSEDALMHIPRTKDGKITPFEL